MAQHTWKIGLVLAGDDVLIAVTHTRCTHLDQNFTLLRVIQIECLDVGRAAHNIERDGSDLHDLPSELNTVRPVAGQQRWFW